jgi:predicted nicotinamide N-methyase
MSADDPRVLSTTAGELPLEEIRLQVEGREWSVLTTGALVSRADEEHFLVDEARDLPYGIVLWPAAIALAHELAARPVAGRRVLELGAGTGLPGIVAASLGARVVQTDKHPVALHLCKMNAARNGITTIEHRAADWAAWADRDAYDLIIGSDVLYSDTLHPHLRRIFAENLAPGGTLLLADPFRKLAVAFLEKLEADGWRVSMTKWSIGAAAPARAVGVFEVTRR